ncbi:putative diacylglycerol acyltransferase [Leptomonas pyrrhocoris]|uniref:Putative diacylglycerol acyltransferase n=1 Tax=Leptomonas pyrrhocoris TaxID=157538 RepID=A0A0M9G2C3_LEPPY|nr:putative diacylglycerol acyltransferase [Leptomonas pyrrhocoris]KPA81000.1 putative diacylglycerol acyltransferase [Leptomonas pyrrhocoris]|eukprot:XP_015659439.1 putative diacylglycerol acyltransferase [Leptomonas pyrrhocoris]
MSDQVESKAAQEKAPAASAAATRASPPPPPHEIGDVDNRGTPPLANASSYSIGSSSHDGSPLLAAQARLASAIFQRETSTFRNDGTESKSLFRYELPEFSTVSLITVWGVDCVAGLFCLLLCDLYVNETAEFPLTFFLALGAQLNLLAGVFVYLLGRSMFGASVYRFYQPFTGGVRFVTLQFFGVMSVASSLLFCAGFGLLYDPNEVHTHGFLSTVATLALFGNILTLASLRSFTPYSKHAETPVPAASRGSAHTAEPRSGAAVLAEGGLNAVLRFLCRRPNTESALQVAMLVAQNLLSCVAISFPQLQYTIFVFNFAITIACGVLSIFFVSYRKGRGYTGLRLFLPRTWDAVILWVTRLFYILALFANTLLIDASDETVQSSSVLAVQGLNVVSCIALLLFMRTLHYETFSDASAMPSSVFELGGVVTVASCFVVACVNIGIFFYVQNFPAGLEEVIEGTSWTYRGVLIFVSQVAQLVSLLPTPLVYMAGVIIHGERFQTLTPQREAATFPVLIMQGLSYLLYIAAVINFVLYLTSKVPTFAALESTFSVLSVICMASSVRIYTFVMLNLNCFVPSSPTTTTTTATPAAGNAAGGGKGRMSEAKVAAEKALEAAAGVTDATPEWSAAVKLASVLPSRPTEAQRAAAGTADTARQPEYEFPTVSYIMNDKLIISYLLCLTNIMLRLIVDVSLHRIWGDVELPYYRLITIGNLCFFACVPLAHYSATDKGIRVFHPFSGSGGFVALQVLGWMLYATFVITTVFGTVLAMNSDKVPEELVTVMNRGNVFYTLFGLLELIPLGLITLSIVIEARYTLASAVQQRLAKEAFLELRRILRKEVQDKPEDEKAVTQVAFQTLMTAALRSFSLPISHSMLRLYKEDAAERQARKAWPRVRSDDDEDEEEEESRAGSASDVDESSDSSDWVEEKGEDVLTRQRRQEGARVIVILLCCASAAFFVIAAFTAQVLVLSLAFAVIAMLVTTASCLGVHAGYGAILYGDSDTYSPFMPFRGGTPFVVRQMAGWGCYASAFLVTLISCMESAEVSATSMVLAAFLSVCSQVFIFTSIPLFSDRRGEPPFLEVNGEGIVAVLTFAAAIAFGRVYTSVIAFFKGDAEQLQYLENGGTSRRTRVPFVLVVISLSFAVPCTLIALSRTKRQWQQVIRKARLAASSRGESTEAAKGGRSTSKQSRRASTKEPAPHMMLATGVANLLEVLVILFGTVTPATVIVGVYYFSTHYTPWLVRIVESWTPIFFAVTTMTLLLSVVPYLVNVGVPPFVITVRVTIVTWVLYSVPVVAASFLLLPCVLAPRYSTWFLFGATFVLTLVGNFNHVRVMIKMAVYFSIGYLSYNKFVFYQACGSSVSWLLVMRMAGVHLLDCLLLGFWLLYIPTYSGKPFLTGAQRSAAFIGFMRNYVFTDAQRYFNFSVLVDDPQVQMRDGKTQYLFSFHPHGVFPGTALYASMTNEWVRKIGINAERYVSTHVASIIFNVPIVRDFNLRLGALSVSRRTLEASLRRGNSVLIVTGGQAEMLHTTISRTKMTLITQHTGFVRLAIAMRVPLVPLLSFAENNILGLMQFPRIQRIALKIVGFPFPMVVYGRFGLPLPFRSRLTVVVGTPVAIPEGADENNPEDVKKLSEAYFAAVKELFYRRRAEAGYPEMELELRNDKEEAAKRKAAAAEARKAAAQ